MKIQFANPFSLKFCSNSNISLVLCQKNMYTQYPWHLNCVPMYDWLSGYHRPQIKDQKLYHL